MVSHLSMNPAKQGLTFLKGRDAVRNDISPQVAHEAGAYPGFSSMKLLLGAILFLPGWDARSSQAYPPTLYSPVPIYTPSWWRDAL